MCGVELVLVAVLQSFLNHGGVAIEHDLSSEILGLVKKSSAVFDLG